MHTNLAMRRLSGVALAAVAAVGMGTVLAVPAAAAATSLSASPQQPRYPVNAQATITVTSSGGVGDTITGTVTSGPDAGAPLTCSALAANGAGAGSATCTFRNGGGVAGTPGVDQIRITDSTLPAPAATATTSVAFENITAVPDQNVGTAATPVYLYGTSETATIAVTITGPSSTPSLKGVVNPGGPDANTTLPCTQSPVQAGSWTCTLTNHGSAGTDTVVLFDDDNPNGLNGQPDSSEASVTVPVHFEQITGTPEFARDGTPSGTIDVTVTGIPNVGGTPRTPVLKEVVKSGQFTTAGPCTENAGGNPQNWTCTVSNGGRNDSAVVQIYDDLDGNNSPGSGEPSTLVTLSFETLTVTDTNAPHAPNSTATFDVTIAGAPSGSSPGIDYVIVSGPDAATPPATVGTLCSGAGSSWTCQLKNTKQAPDGTAVDTVKVFDDANNNRTADPGEATTTATITFGSSVSATPDSATYPVFDTNNSGSGRATVSASVVAPVGSVPHLRWTVTNGPDAGNPAHTSQNCTPLNGGTTDWSCDFSNGGQAGVDTVVIYNDVNFQQFGNNETPAQAAFAPSDPNDVIKATFAAPQSVSLTPTLGPNQHQASIATGGCQIYTVDVNPALKFPVSITASEGLPAPSNSNPLSPGPAPAAALSTCNVPGGSNITTVSNSVTSTGGSIFTAPTYTNTLTLSSTTGQDPAHPGRVVFGLSSKQAGTVSVRAQTTNATAANNASSPTQTMSVITGGQTAVKTLTVNPTSQTGTVNGSLTYTVAATDANGTPLNGVTIDYVVASGDPDATTAAVACAVADQFGNAKCVVKNGGKTGLDHLTFFAPQTSGETAPTASDPQVTATGTFQPAPPAGSTMSLSCGDELVTDANQLVPNCTVTTGSGGQRQIIFVAHLAGPGGAALPNIPVQFTLSSAPSGATATANQTPTNANGNAFFVVTVPSPANGQRVTVQAVVGDPAQGGLGPDTATATLQSPQPSRLTVTPASQRASSGGVVQVSARVTDQFGVGVAGQQLSYAVSGRNSTSGNAVTGSNGTASISYVDNGGSGSDTISVLDTSADAPTSNNPATAVVTYGSGGGGGGCISNCGTAKEHPTLSVSQKSKGSQEKLTLLVKSRPKLVGAKVIFYSVKHGARHKIGVGHTGRKGKVTGTLRAAHGLHLRFQAKVVGRAGVRSGYSNVVKVHVR